MPSKNIEAPIRSTWISYFRMVKWVSIVCASKRRERRSIGGMISSPNSLSKMRSFSCCLVTVSNKKTMLIFHWAILTAMWRWWNWWGDWMESIGMTQMCILWRRCWCIHWRGGRCLFWPSHHTMPKRIFLSRGYRIACFLRTYSKIGHISSKSQ